MKQVVEGCKVVFEDKSGEIDGKQMEWVDMKIYINDVPIRVSVKTADKGLFSFVRSQIGK